VRLIALVRDPVERALSQHAHEVARGFETEPDFARALELEPSRVDGELSRMLADPAYRSFAHQHHAYRARGEYATHLRRLADLVGRDRLHVIEAERFFAKPEETYDDVLDFLGLPRLGYPSFEQHNARPRTMDMPAALRAELREHYRPYNEQLCAFLGRGVSWYP
jgi:hypothetical protein